jgi:hypothetical protein
MHLPKSGGVALANCLIEGLAPRTVIPDAFDCVLFGSFRSFETLNCTLRRRIFADSSTVPRDADFVAGHLAVSTITQCYSQANTITVVREPRARILSHWCYWRSSPDEELAMWGDWATRLLLARQSLSSFLSAPEIACQTDNLCTRMLLWPDRLIPDNSFIEAGADQVLVRAALVRLSQFTYADLIENPAFLTNLETWLSRELNFKQENETGPPTDAMKTSLYDELTGDAFDLIDARTRLDREIWLAVAQSRLPNLSAELLSERTFARSIARYSALTAPLQPV